MRMPYGSGITVGGWISIVLGIVILAVMVFGLLQAMKLMNAINANLSEVRNEIDRMKDDVEEIRKKLEEV